MKRIAVLASGRGSNLAALHAYLSRTEPAAAEITLVASDHRDAGALALAREAGIDAVPLDRLRDDGPAMLALLHERGIALVVLAGYLRLVPEAVVRAFRGAIVNVHPALLPAFGGTGMYGSRVHRAVLERGMRVTGATVHFVDEVYDRGAVIAQWPVPVRDGDTPDSLAARVLRVEHLLLPRAVDAVARGRVEIDGDGRARWAPRPPRDGGRDAFTLGSVEDDALARNITAALGG